MLSGQKAAEILPLSSLYLILNVKIQKWDFTHRVGSFLFSSDSKLMGISEKGNKYPSMKQKKHTLCYLEEGLCVRACVRESGWIITLSLVIKWLNPVLLLCSGQLSAFLRLRPAGDGNACCMRGVVFLSVACTPILSVCA